MHGAFCVGCCWFLMGLLFFGGVMNLYWIVGLALFVLFEKTVPAGHWLGYATGVALLIWVPGCWRSSSERDMQASRRAPRAFPGGPVAGGSARR
jgi:predicted metal-binding membrane protein